MFARSQFETPVWERQMRIQTTGLRLGHFVSNIEIGWQNSPFTLEGVLIDKQSQIRWFKDNCRWVVIDLVKSQARTGTAHQKRHQRQTMQTPVTRQSMRSALKSYVGLEREVTAILNSMRAKQFTVTERMKASINSTAAQLFDHGPALIWLTHIKSKDNYTAEHCLNVAILAMGLAHSLGWSQKQVCEAGLAGLLHDVGKVLIPSHILNKPTALTASELTIMRQHTLKGFAMIADEEGLTETVKNTVLNHHERPDGQGYPGKLMQHQIAETTALISVVDAYDAITSNRCYQKAQNHHLALSILWKGRGSQFNALMVEAFIQWIGWVSPGTIVELTNAEKAIVIMANAGNRLQPTVRILIEENQQTRLGPIQPLSQICDQHGKPVYISRVLDSIEANVDMRNLSRDMMIQE